jgi:hypothetical protein
MRKQSFKQEYLQQQSWPSKLRFAKAVEARLSGKESEIHEKQS